MLDKNAVIQLFREEIIKKLDISEKNTDMQKEFIADSPGPMQSRYDSALVEGQWLLSGMQETHDKMLKLLAYLDHLQQEESVHDTVKEGSLISLNYNGKKTHYLLLGTVGSGGFSVTYEGSKIMGISPQSPIGTALIRRKAGDDIEIKTSTVMRYIIESIS